MTHPHTSFMLSLSDFERKIMQFSKTAEGFPPYNLERVDEFGLLLTLAVAGYAKEDLEVFFEETKLVIKGHQRDKQEKDFLHRGIAARNFIKTFVIVEKMYIKDVILEDGLLMIELEKPRETPAKKIPIRSKKNKIHFKDS